MCCSKARGDHQRCELDGRKKRRYRSYNYIIYTAMVVGMDGISLAMKTAGGKGGPHADIFDREQRARGKTPTQPTNKLTRRNLNNGRSKIFSHTHCCDHEALNFSLPLFPPDYLLSRLYQESRASMYVYHTYSKANHQPPTNRPTNPDLSTSKTMQ
ncbi:hypothetical protein F4778DRAFT_133009 [Xylariomycetidae sp. FL2044]|nr:hypothetical protein F4778DRAFT_133009 [Xylariomycetidae sp. FL2044]